MIKNIKIKTISAIQNYLVFTIGLFILSACEKQDTNIPYVPVSVSINLNDPEFFDLRSPNTSIVLKDVAPLSQDGYAGIIIVRADYTTFYAYDQCCTHQPLNKDKVIPNGAIGTCESCGSEFFLLDGSGSILSGEADKFLRSYNVNFSGNYLTITN